MNQVTERSAKIEELNEERHPYIIFKVNKEEYAIRIEQVKEVTITPAITRLPHSPSSVKGIANIRGEIVAIIDLESKFTLPGDDFSSTADERQDDRTYTLVVEKGDHKMGLLVREVPHTFSIYNSQIDKAPELVKNSGFNERFVEAIAKAGDRLIVILDLHKVLDLKEEKQLLNL